MKSFLSFLLLTLSFILFPLNNLYSQQAEGALKRGPTIIPEAYDRSSLSWVLVYNRGDSYVDRINQSYSKIDHSDKFFLNPLEVNMIEFSGARSATNNRISREFILNSFKEKNFARQIISHWYSRTDEGFMNMEIIHQRGMENATDADVLRYQATTRGNWALMDYGNRLIDKSYIVALDFNDVTKVNTDSYEGYRARITATLFRINLSEEDKMNIYEAWAEEGDSEEEIRRKTELFNSLNPPVKFVTQITTSVNAYNYKEHTFLGKITPTRTTEQLFDHLVQTGYNNVLFELERDYDDFNVITPLYSTRPLQAKIGKREGLSVDQRFFVYEHRYDPQTQSIREVRRGVIRATTDITDNRGVATGETKPSRFYQVAGRRLEEGYVLQQSNDLGIGLFFGADIGEIGGGSVGLDYSVGRVIGIRALYLTGSVGLNSKEYPQRILQYSYEGKMTFLRWDVGLAKGMHFFRNFELRPYVLYGQEQASHDDLDDPLTGHYIKAGANLALNITHSVQIVAGYNFYVLFGNAYQDEDPLNYKYNEIFENREGGAIFAGLRFKF